MPDPETVLWGIRAGRNGEFDSLFLTKNVVGIGWRKLGDLGKQPADREAFKAAVTASRKYRSPPPSHWPPLGS